MSSALAPRVFISYSRKDGTDFAEKVRDEFDGVDRGLGFNVKDSLPLWRDIDDLRGGEDWWSQIEAALRSKTVEYLVIGVTPEALQSPVIRREIRLPPQEGAQVSAIDAPDFILKSVRSGHSSPTGQVASAQHACAIAMRQWLAEVLAGGPRESQSMPITFARVTSDGQKHIAFTRVKRGKAKHIRTFFKYTRRPAYGGRVHQLRQGGPTDGRAACALDHHSRLFGLVGSRT